MTTEAEATLRRLTRARDLIGLRDALKEHAEAAAGTQVLAEAQAVHDELLASKLNDRHEAWLEAQEWPLADNSFYSRAGHPLASRLQKPWPNPTSRVVHGGRHAGEWPPSQKTADMRQEEWLNDAWPSQGWRHPTTGWIFDPSEFPNGRPPLQPIPDWPLLPRDPASIPPDNPGPTVAESEAALRAAAASRDVMEIRAAMSVHAANVGEESASLSRAKAVVEELLPITANMRHEAKLDAQEWPGPTNNYFSRAGHPLETSLRHASWPKTADWPPHEALRPPAPASKDPFLAKHRPPSVAYRDFRPLSHVSLADFGPGRDGQRGTQPATSGEPSTSPQAEGRRIGATKSTAPPLDPDWWPTESRHQVRYICIYAHAFMGAWAHAHTLQPNYRGPAPLSGRWPERTLPESLCWPSSSTRWVATSLSHGHLSLSPLAWSPFALSTRTPVKPFPLCALAFLLWHRRVGWLLSP